MSTADCRRCGGEISFVLGVNGNWRPVEPSYTALELDEDEVTTLRVDGNWTAQVNTELRVYRYHRCPEDPALRRGQARTVVVTPDVVDLDTGVVESGAYRCPICGDVDDHSEDECPEGDQEAWQQAQAERLYERCKQKIPSTQVGVACPACTAQPGEPCWTANGGYREATHNQRGWVTAFDDDQPWPPDPKQRGYPVMKRWLREHADLFATPQEVQ